jgi:hypothetical protein
VNETSEAPVNEIQYKLSPEELTTENRNEEVSCGDVFGAAVAVLQGTRSSAAKLDVNKK